MKRLVVILCVGVFLAASVQEVFAQEKKFQVYCGKVSAWSDEHFPPGNSEAYPWPQCGYPFVLNSGYYDSEGLEEFVPGRKLCRDFSIGVLVPVYISNCSARGIPTTIKSGGVSWTDFAGIEVEKYEDVERNKPDNWSDDEWRLVEPKSTWKVSLFSYMGDEESVLEDQGSLVDGVWLQVEFDNPSALDDGIYYFFPEFDFAAMAAALPDLSTLEQPIEQMSLSENYARHTKIDISTTDGKRRAMNLYLVEAERMYGFGKQDKMQEYVDKVFNINPDSAPALIILAGKDILERNINSALSKLVEAKDILENSRDTCLGKEERAWLLQYVYQHIGHCYHQLGDCQNAETYYLASIEMFKDEAFSVESAVDAAAFGELKFCLDKAREGETVNYYF
jgi:hypothetical protein